MARNLARRYEGAGGRWASEIETALMMSEEEEIEESEVQEAGLQKGWTNLMIRPKRLACSF